MSTWFIATIPFDGTGPKLLPNIDTLIANGRVWVERDGKSFKFKEYPDEGQTTRRELRSLVGKYLGRLDEGQFGTTGRPAVVVCSGSKSAFQWLKDRIVGNPDYNFASLEATWQIEDRRDWLKANGMPWVAGEFGPVPGSTYGRPTLPIVWCMQSHDVFAPEEPELP